jgi:hypothetical protein
MNIVVFQMDTVIFVFYFCSGKGRCAGIVTGCDSSAAKNCHPAAQAGGCGPRWARMTMDFCTDKGPSA